MSHRRFFKSLAAMLSKGNLAYGHWARATGARRLERPVYPGEMSIGEGDRCGGFSYQSFV